MEGVLSIVLEVAAIASLVFAVVMAVRSGRGGEVDEEKMERRFEIVCGVIVLGVIGAVAWWLELGGIVLVLLAVLLLKGGLVQVLMRMWWLLIVLGMVGLLIALV